jgi:hypothetical protein
MADKGTAAKLIEVATAELGTIEGPKDNETKYGAYTKANFQPWCGSFVNWCANEAGVKVPNTVYTPGGAAAFKKANSWIDGDIADPDAGDIAYFDFPSDGVSLTLELLLRTTAMEQSGALKETQAQMIRDHSVTVVRYLRSFVLTRRILRRFLFQS